MSAPDPISEVTDPTPLPSVKEQMTVFSSGMEAIFNKIAEKLTTHQTVQTSLPKLINFDPDESEADIVNWCTLSELIIKNKNLKEVDLILALTHALKGRAATCLTKIQTDKISWPAIKEMLISRFSKPMMMQDHFDQIIKFHIDGKESPAETGMRLWGLIEKNPDSNMPENVITGFAISVLSQCDEKIRRELNSVVINDKNQLFRTLRSFTLKRRNEDPVSTESDAKRFRITPFRGNCHFCGRPGHRGQECRDKSRLITKFPPATTKFEQRPSVTSSRPTVSCYVCGDPGHVVSGCPMRYKKKENGGSDVAPTSSKQVNVCTRTSHGILQISGIMLPFIFDSGSECSLIKQSHCGTLKGERFYEQVSLKGLGGNRVTSSLQIKCPTKIQALTLEVLYHVLPDDSLSDDVLLGRDILDTGVSVVLGADGLVFTRSKNTNCCTVFNVFDVKTIDTDLEGKDRERLFKLLEKYSNNFIQKLPTTQIKTGELKIELKDSSKTVHRRPYRLSPTELNVVNEKIQELLDANIIRESTSPFASPILLVKKKDGSDRLCVDYRELNSNTLSDNYPLPLISDQIDKLNGAKYFCSIDMASGFHQIRVHEDSVEKTAFVTPTGQYEYLTMPFGLKNAPQVFQRSINFALKPLNDTRILVYMDDVLSVSETVDEGLSRLDKLLETLSNAGFSFNFKKCKFMKKEVEYLGYVISSGELKPNPRKVQALQNAPKPGNVKQVRQLIGLATYFRQFIPNFSKLLRPLYPLTSGKGPIVWTAEHDGIHDEIVKHLVTEPVLKIFNPSLPIELHTDASTNGYGAVLIQKYVDLPHVVAYFSRKTSDAESRYHSYELETLAVVKSVEYFRHYLYGRKFTVFTDCNALKSSHSKRDLTPRVHRWWAILQSYDFDIVYKEGKNMAHADFLSRNSPPASQDFKSKSKIVNFSELEKGWLAVEQQRDSQISNIICKIQSNDIPLEITRTYDIRQGVLYRKIERAKTTKWLPILPHSLIWSFINHVHGEIKHLGYEKTLDKMYELYWFQNMSRNVKKFVDSCVVCKSSKGPSGAQQVRLHPIPKAAVPWHTLHIDLTGKLSGKSDRKEYCSVIIDAFTKFVLLKHTSTLNSANAIKVVKESVHLFGAPKRIIADRGRSYDNFDFKQFCESNNIDLHLIATGSSRANGQVERVMRTLKGLLTIAECSSNHSWQDQLGDIQLALNSTRSRVTGFTPIELMFGSQGSSLEIARISSNFTEPTRLDLEAARSKAFDSIKKSAQSETLRFNRGKARVKPFSVGDFVFVKSEERHQTKLNRKYKGPFKISAVLENDRYELRHINGSNRIYKHAHENLREVPRGPLGLLEVSEGFDTEDGVTASKDNDLVHEANCHTDDITIPSLSSDTMTVDNDNNFVNLGRSRTDSEGNSS